MAGYPNIYATVVFDLHPKVRDYLDQLNSDGQIDLDDTGYPYLVRCDKQGPNYVTQISRNNRVEQFVLNPRKKARPVCSWDFNDGFVRKPHQRRQVVEPADGETAKRERPRRVVPMTAFEKIVEDILGG